MLESSVQRKQGEKFMTEKKKQALLINISVLLPDELAKYVAEIAEREHASKAWAIRKIILEHKQFNTLQSKPPVTIGGKK